MCVDREFDEDNGKGNTVLIGCLEDFIPTITEVSYEVVEHDACMSQKLRTGCDILLYGSL